MTFRAPKLQATPDLACSGGPALHLGVHTFSGLNLSRWCATLDQAYTS